MHLIEYIITPDVKLIGLAWPETWHDLATYLANWRQSVVVNGTTYDSSNAISGVH